MPVIRKSSQEVVNLLIIANRKQTGDIKEFYCCCEVLNDMNVFLADVFFS